MDHVIVTNFEGDVAIYRGPELVPLIREVLETEFDPTPLEMEDPDPEFDPALIEAIRDPSIKTLDAALESMDTDMFYSGPEAPAAEK